MAGEHDLGLLVIAGVERRDQVGQFDHRPVGFRPWLMMEPYEQLLRKVRSSAGEQVEGVPEHVLNTLRFLADRQCELSPGFVDFAEVEPSLPQVQMPASVHGSSFLVKTFGSGPVLQPADTAAPVGQVGRSQTPKLEPIRSAAPGVRPRAIRGDQPHGFRLIGQELFRSAGASRYRDGRGP